MSPAIRAAARAVTASALPSPTGRDLAPALTERSVQSPVGALRLLASRDALVGVYFPDHRPAPRLPAEIRREETGAHPVLAQAARELAEYFAGQRERFTVPLRPEGTDFQRAVWQALLDIPHGQTRSYGELARALGCPEAVRAVGAANGRNPLSILVPCHRVIGAGGALTGYAGGLAAKRWLLAHEGQRALPLDVPHI